MSEKDVLPVTTTYSTIWRTPSHIVNDWFDALEDAAGFGTGRQRVTVCHIPPGNRSRAHEIHISASGGQAHVAHGCYLGPCCDICVGEGGQQAEITLGANPIGGNCTAAGGGGGAVQVDAESNGPYSGTVGQSISFSNAGSTSGGGVSYTWVFGDGGNSSAANPTHTYASAGTYNVCITVRKAGRSDTDCTTADISDVAGNDPPVANANGPYNAELGNPVVFSSVGSYAAEAAMVNKSWDVGHSDSYPDSGPTYACALANTRTATSGANDIRQ
ncbi:MAG: PKD domain-containing protein, partial [Planctomycetes bacterium]|nr:PKD domain-containing protein [Planctomycetota bacterium]